MSDRKTLTTESGIPVGDNQNSLSAGPRGPLLTQDWQLFEKHAHFNRERIQERIVHAKGSAAYGTLTIAQDITRYTKARLFSAVGKQTEVFVRFSTVAGERGAADAERDMRGFALKFSTEEGNRDLAGNNTPVFFVRDPLKFPDFIHTQKPDPRTNLRNPTAMWDFWSLSPEALHQGRSCSPTAACRRRCGTCTVSVHIRSASSTAPASTTGSSSTSSPCRASKT